jgi:hypothetical protein
MRNLDKEIIGYIETKYEENPNDIWVNLQKMVNDLEIKTMGDYNDLINAINYLAINGKIRITEKEENGSKIAKMTLEMYVEDILNKRKLSAKEEIQAEIDKAVEEENYEEAAEWKKILDNK